MIEDYIANDGMLGILKMVSPGMPLRDGIDNILKAKTGGLIVIGDSEDVMKAVDGGFLINKEYSPSHLYELAKMDGAIVISEDLERIIYANALLIPDPSIATTETGTRHKCAERMARQTSKTVICISQRRNVITVYKSNNKYTLKETSAIIAKANQALQTLEKYKFVLDRALSNLGVLEFEDAVTLEDVATVIQRVEMVMRIVNEIKWYSCELGNESRLIQMQLNELLSNVEEEGVHVIEDYMSSELVPHKNSWDIQKQIGQLMYENIMDLTFICNILGYRGEIDCFDTPVSARGYRMLNKIHRVPTPIIKNLINKFNNFQGILNASVQELDTVDGIGSIRAKAIRAGLDELYSELSRGRLLASASAYEGHALT